MLSYEEARSRILADIDVLESEDVALEVASGRTLARDLVASHDQPPFNASAMDGYAVRWEDLPGPFKLVGESAAGMAFGETVGRAEAVRIFTGAPLPAGADTVLVQEDCTADGTDIRLTGSGPAASGSHIRRRGMDFANADLLISAGTRLTPRHLALAAAGGHGRLAVNRPPRVALIANGDELVLPGTALSPGQITASSSPMIAASLRHAGADVDDFGIVADEATELKTALLKASAYDIVVTMGGASVGDHDHMHSAMEAAGAERDFWRVAIRPGKPLIHGRIGAATLVGLPGNPVSAYVCALLFVAPLIAAFQGQPPGPATTTARLREQLPANGARRDHLRAVVEGGWVRPLATQDSSQLAVFASANALIVREAHAPQAADGDEVEVIPLDSFPAAS
ncbi:molybdopterin molybdenumtransferase MoeA [Pacificimonas flava]|uniref:Molybdopterin molybdenumtransferase n=2 Tax=Pacificimonas TaxID=1960290 RepID=A0A219B7E6_9SPHN|nr:MULTISPECIES: gephyrin-like molybdotransferase Glp [Pacificimonas]MBZ6378621.1 molybdopterin molybdotransferase MoeA [Pacificimonas aurantium]OWV34104.1 molybdopterin molybdenumtransferase MoeA [Pacificimonas flava]